MISSQKWEEGRGKTDPVRVLGGAELSLVLVYAGHDGSRRDGAEDEEEAKLGRVRVAEETVPRFLCHRSISVGSDSIQKLR